MAEPQYFYQLDRTIHGPISFAELAARAQRGQIGPDTFVRADGDGQTWGPASNLKGLEFREPAPVTASATPGSLQFEPPGYSALTFCSVALIGLGILSVCAAVLLPWGARTPEDAIAVVAYAGFAGVGLIVLGLLIPLAIDVARHVALQSVLLRRMLDRMPPNE